METLASFLLVAARGNCDDTVSKADRPHANGSHASAIAAALGISWNKLRGEMKKLQIFYEALQ